ncbi:hypothetical protein Hanom_Chr01g00069781 [Helianthus anomalus]
MLLTVINICYYINFFYCSKLMVENGAPPVTMAANKDEIMTKVDANVHDVMAMDVEATEKPSESSPMITVHVESGIEAAPNIEHQFISSFPSHQMGTYENSNLQIHQSSLRNRSEEISIGLQLSEPGLKR